MKHFGLYITTHTVKLADLDTGRIIAFSREHINETLEKHQNNYTLVLL
jgi:hypothetical protein